MRLCVSVRPSLVVVLINVEAEGVHPQPQLGALLVLDLKVVDPIHLQVLGNFQIFHHGVLPVGKATISFGFTSDCAQNTGTQADYSKLAKLRDIHKPEHVFVLFVPRLYAVLPLLLGQLVLLQDSAQRKDTATSTAATPKRFPEFAMRDA